MVFSDSLAFSASIALFFVPKDPLGPDFGPTHNFTFFLVVLVGWPGLLAGGFLWFPALLRGWPGLLANPLVSGAPYGLAGTPCESLGFRRSLGGLICGSLGASFKNS